jgi:hypothetical protein
MNSELDKRCIWRLSDDITTPSPIPDRVFSRRDTAIIMPTYSELSYDILHQLCALIGKVDFDTLKAFSQVDKRTRSAAVPTLFYAIGFRQHWGKKENLNALLSNKEALAAVRFASPFPKPDHF